MSIEYEKKAWSVPKAVALSFLPGAGWGLVYAEKPAQSTIPILVSAVGYGVGIAFALGAFDKSSDDACKHVRDGEVEFGECRIGDTAGDNQQVDPRSVTADNPNGLKYFETQADYEIATIGEDFDGMNTGILILAATYAGTSILGAVWSGLVVSDHNEQLRRDIEATVQAPAPTAQPVVAYDGERGFMGIRVEF